MYQGNRMFAVDVTHYQETLLSFAMLYAVPVENI